MRESRLFVDAALSEGQELNVPSQAAHYVHTVLRLPRGAEIRLFNGDGREYRASILDSDRRGLRLLVGETLAADPESPLRIRLGVGLARGERMDWIVQKATELGVASITPLLLERCNAKLDRSRQENRLRHWRQVAVSACEQCGRNRIPEVATPERLESWLEQNRGGMGLVLHTAQARALDARAAPPSVNVLVGPEGGLTEREYSSAVSEGFLPWSLGPRVLRTETAPVAALAILQFLWGDMGTAREGADAAQPASAPPISPSM